MPNALSSLLLLLMLDSSTRLGTASLVFNARCCLYGCLIGDFPFLYGNNPRGIIPVLNVPYVRK